MSKPATLATCIAKMYEGAKLDNSGAASGTPKKASPNLLCALGKIEGKINTLEGRVEQIVNTQTLVLQKLDLMCQGMGSLERNLAQMRVEAPTRPLVKSDKKSSDAAAITEVKSLCGESVSLLRNLKQEGQLQRRKLEGLESTMTTLEKVFGYVGEAFRSSKIVEFILSGIVPWRKRGLLEATEEEKEKEEEEEKSRVEDDAVKAKASLCHRGTQTLEEINEEAAGFHHQEQNATTSALVLGGSCDAGTEETPSPSSGSKTQRRPKEVTLKSRETDRVQAFAPLSLTESEDPKAVPVETVSVTEVSLLERRVPEEAEVSPPLLQQSVDSTVKDEPDHQDKDESKTEDLPKGSSLSTKPHTAVEENMDPASQQKERLLGITQLSLESGAQSESQPEPVALKRSSETPESVLEKDKPSQIEGSPLNDGGDTASEAQTTKSTVLDLQFAIIDDCPPRPAPFEHRIVSAKQVPIGSYYTVQPNALLGGGRFGQVHKCAELSSGLHLAAKIIKVKGMKEREEVKNEIGMMNQLNHVNLIQLYDAFESRSNLTLIMEYVEGGELFERIVDEHFHLTELDAIVFTRQICEGVQYLHQQYILHLDLKPENILCVSTTGNQIKIIDFGLARKYRPREKLKVNFGTPEFLAPEVVNYDFVSFPTDMWSVGVITYMLLSGLSPFLGENDAETMSNILHANWDFDSDAFENVSEEAKDFISRLLVPAKCGRLSASGCMKHSWLNNLEEKAKKHRVRLKSQMRLQRYLAAHRQWKKHFNVVAAANRLKRFQKSRAVSTL